MTKTALASCLVALLAACSDPTGGEPARLPDVEFAVLATAFAPGDTVFAELRNAGAEGVGFNLCFTDLERRTDSRWRLAEEFFGLPANGACLANVAVLAPGTTGRSRYAIRRDLPAGKYRLRTTLVSLDSSGDRTVRTQAFTVGR
jgi:hypothetical protein